MVYHQVSKGDIRNAIQEHSDEKIKAEVEASRKVGDRATADPYHRKYLTYMTLPNSRTWMRVRARSIKGVKVNNKRSFTYNLWCRFCDVITPLQTVHNKNSGLQILNMSYTITA